MPEYIRWLLPLISFQQAIIILSVMLLLFLVLGRFTLKVFRVDKYLSSNFAVNVPIYGVAGFVFSTLVLNIIAIFSIGTFSLIIFLIITASSIFILWKLGDFRLIFNKARILVSRTKNPNLLRTLSTYLVPLFLIVLTLYHFSTATAIMGWPPLGDTIWAHAPWTSLLLYNGKITPNFEPLTSIPVNYPLGYHVVAANFASWFDLFAGEAVFLLSGLLITLIPLLIYSLTYILTRSVPLSLITFFATFIIHPGPGNWARWIIGYFYGGGVTSLAGILITIFSVVILSLDYAQPKKVEKQELHTSSVLTLFLPFLALILLYPSFSILVMMMIIFILARHFVEVTSFLQKKPILMLPPLALGILFMFIPNPSYAYLSDPYFFVSRAGSKAFTLSPTFLFDHITGYVMFIALFVSVILLYRKKYLFLLLFYVIVFCVMIFTLSPYTLRLLISILLPSRVIMIPWLMSWVILVLGFAEVMRMRGLRKYFNSQTNTAIILSISLIIIILLPQFTPSIIQEFSYNNTKLWGWFPTWRSFLYDYPAMLWISYNVPPEDLILIDRSISSTFMLSFSFKNITFFDFRQMDSYQIKRLFELEPIWDNPYNNDTVYQLLKEYNVSYIFVTTEPSHLALSKTSEGIPHIADYQRKPFTPGQYVSIFNTYPFLKTVFQLGFTTVYKVNIASK